MSHLAEALDVSVASMTGIVDRMEKRGSWSVVTRVRIDGWSWSTRPRRGVMSSARSTSGGMSAFGKFSSVSTPMN